MWVSVLKVTEGNSRRKGWEMWLPLVGVPRFTADQTSHNTEYDTLLNHPILWDLIKDVRRRQKPWPNP